MTRYYMIVGYDPKDQYGVEFDAVDFNEATRIAIAYVCGANRHSDDLRRLFIESVMTRKTRGFQYMVLS